MNKPELHQRLEELHAELTNAQTVDASEREVLEELQRDIGVLLAKGDDAGAPEYAGLGRRLRESVEKLEASHPQASLLMGQVIDALANLGI